MLCVMMTTWSDRIHYVHMHAQHTVADDFFVRLNFCSKPCTHTFVGINLAYVPLWLL